MTTLELLKPFLAHNESRWFLNHYHRHSGRLIATDGKIMATLPDDPTAEFQKAENAPNFAPHMAHLDREWPELLPLPERDIKLEGCSECLGFGVEPARLPCEECAGDGECSKCGATCEKCESGTVKNPQAGQPCGDCDGSGQVVETRTVEVFGQKMGAHYYRLLKNRGARVAFIGSKMYGFEDDRGVRGILMIVEDLR